MDLLWLSVMLWELSEFSNTMSVIDHKEKVFWMIISLLFEVCIDWVSLNVWSIWIECIWGIGKWLSPLYPCHWGTLQGYAAWSGEVTWNMFESLVPDAYLWRISCGHLLLRQLEAGLCLLGPRAQWPLWHFAVTENTWATVMLACFSYYSSPFLG